MILLRQSTATTRLIGPFLNEDDGKTDETGLTITQAEVRLSKNGGNMAQKAESTSLVHDELGMYTCLLDSDDTDTLGALKLVIHEATALPVWVDFFVITANAYDSKAGSDILQSDLTQIGGVAQSAVDLKDFADAGYDPATKKVQGVVLTDTATDVSNQVTADMTAISGDATAANNLEATYDGSGYDNAVAPAQQQQVSNIASGSSAIATTATTAVITTGTPTLTYTATQAEDGILHEIADVAGTTDLYYEFFIGGNGVPNSVGMVGYLTGINDTMPVYGYNWGATAWVQVGTIQGAVLASEQEFGFTLLNTMVGTGVDAGKVRVRFANTGLTTSNLAVDFLHVNYAVVASSVGYANGSIWINTVNGVSGTVVDVNGVADNPVDSIADAMTLSAATKIKRFEVAPGSTITLAADSTSLIFSGQQWTLALNGQIMTDAAVTGALVSGLPAAASTHTNYTLCHMGTVGLIPGDFHACTLDDTATLLAVGTYIFHACLSGIAGIATPTLDFGAAIGATFANFRRYSGGIEIENMKAGDTMSLEGNGQLIINANCTGGVVAIRGNFTVTDNASAAVTLSDDARYDVGQIEDSCDASLLTYDGPTDTEMIARTLPNAEYATAVEQAKVPKSDSNVVWNATAQTTIQTKAAAALTAYDPPTKAELDNAVAPLSTTVELNKVPKSDGFTSWNATALGAVNAEVDTALNTAVPGGPAANSINQRVVAIDVLSEAGGAGDLAAILVDTKTTIPATLTTMEGKQDTAQIDLTTVTGADGTTLATLQGNYAPNVVVPDAVGVLPTAVENRQEMDSNSTQIAGTIIDEANTELAAFPSTTGSIRQMIQTIFSWIRNKKTVTSAVETVFKEDASTGLGTAALSDDGTTFTKGELS